jgi:hypothetical protein
MKFYNVRKKCRVIIPDSKCTKRKIEGKTRTTYMVKAVDVDGTKLTLFTNKEIYDALACPEE